MIPKDIKTCKWTGKPFCKLARDVGVSAYGSKLEPFECCDNEIAMQKMHCTCQPTTMGYGSYEEFKKDKIGAVIQKSLADFSSQNTFLKQNIYI